MRSPFLPRMVGTAPGCAPHMGDHPAVQVGHGLYRDRVWPGCSAAAELSATAFGRIVSMLECV